MKPKQSLKIELMPDNKCLIEIKAKESNSIQSSLVINNTNKSNNLISTSKENENKSQNDITNLNEFLMVNSMDMDFYLMNMNHVMDLLNRELNYGFLFVFYIF